MDLLHFSMVVPPTLTQRTMEQLTADDHVLSLVVLGSGHTHRMATRSKAEPSERNG